MSHSQYTFLFAAVDGTGHLNACIGIAEGLRDRGHKVVFATPLSWRGNFAKQGFIEELYLEPEEGIDAAANKFNDIVVQNARWMPSIELIGNVHTPTMKEGFRQLKYQHPRFKEIMDTVKPDAVVVDFTIHIPAFMRDDVPWVFSVSCNPLGISNVNVPPACSGYPTDGDRELWKKFHEESRIVNKDFFEEFRNWVLQNGGPSLEFIHPYWVKFSPWANIYMYPLELDYTSLRPAPKNWYRFDTFVRRGDGDVELPKRIAEGTGKLIYFSLGSIGCVNIELMKRLVSILAKSANRFIVSKGSRANEFELPENMWGENSVPQTKVLPLVDLVITHGGNNTITESFYFGKRVLVVPLLWDQLDNAQRVVETGLGKQCNPYKVTEDELLKTIEELLADELLEKRMRTIGQRIRSSNSQSAVADLVEKIAANNQTKNRYRN